MSLNKTQIKWSHVVFGVSNLYMIICEHIEIIGPNMLSKYQNRNLINKFLLNHKENKDNKLLITQPNVGTGENKTDNQKYCLY